MRPWSHQCRPPSGSSLGILVCLLVSALGLSGLPSCNQKKSRDNILRMAIESRPSTLDPRHSTDAAASRIGELVFSSLIKYDENFEMVPDLAERWEISEDGRTYRFYLRRGVRFHDGSELDATDVAFTFDSIRNPETGSVKRQNYVVIERIEVEAPTIVVFHLERPFAPFLANLTLGILPSETDDSEIDAASMPVGSGPFRVVENDVGNLVRLEAFEDYFAGRARLAGIEFHHVAEDTLRILELQKGTIDIIQNDLTPELIPRLRKDPNIRIDSAPGVNYTYLGMNLRDPILSDLRVRRAIAHAIDRDSILGFILRETATRADSILGPSNWAHNPEVRNPSFDPTLAKALLDDAGHVDPDGDGPKKRFRLVYKTSTNELRRRIAEVLRRNLEQVGIDIKIESYEFPTFFADIKKGNFQLFSLTWVGIAEPDILHYIFHSDSFPPHGANRVYYSNPKVDELIDLARVETDQQKRRDYYQRIQEHLSRDLPYISLWYTNNIACLRSDVRGFRLYPAGNYYSLAKVYFETAPSSE